MILVLPRLVDISPAFFLLHIVFSCVCPIFTFYKDTICEVSNFSSFNPLSICLLISQGFLYVREENVMGKVPKNEKPLGDFVWLFLSLPLHYM